MAGTEAVLERAALTRWRVGLTLAFLCGGVTVSAWGPRLPDLAAQLDVTTGQIGAVFAVGTAGAFVGLLTAGPLSRRLGGRRGLLLAVLLLGLSVVVIAGAIAVGALWLIVLGMAANGVGMGLMDVQINVQSAIAERAVGRTIMPQLHGAWSVGVVAGSGIGAACAALAIAPAAQFAGEGALIAVAAVVVARSVPASFADAAPRSTETVRVRLARFARGWADRRLLLIGVVMLGVDFAELAANSWLTLGVQRGHGQTAPVAALFFTVFALSEAVARIVGGPAVDRLGRVAAVRVTAALAAVGLLLFILGGPPWLVLVGVVLWAVGVSMAFPLGMSAAAEGEGDGAGRVGVVTSIGYLAGLSGPPAVGLLAEGVGLLNSLWLVVALVLAALAASGAYRSRTISA